MPNEKLELGTSASSAFKKALEGKVIQSTNIGKRTVTQRCPKFCRSGGRHSQMGEMSALGGGVEA
jgi:hypothetical protein